MADTTLDGATAAAPVPAAAVASRMTISTGTAVAATGGGTAAVLVAYFWRAYMVPRYGLPALSEAEAISVGVALMPVVAGCHWFVRWAIGWLKMPPNQNRRGG